MHSSTPEVAELVGCLGLEIYEEWTAPKGQTPPAVSVPITNFQAIFLHQCISHAPRVGQWRITQASREKLAGDTNGENTVVSSILLIFVLNATLTFGWDSLRNNSLSESCRSFGCLFCINSWGGHEEMTQVCWAICEEFADPVVHAKMGSDLQGPGSSPPNLVNDGLCFGLNFQQCNMMSNLHFKNICAPNHKRLHTRCKTPKLQHFVTHKQTAKLTCLQMHI